MKINKINLITRTGIPEALSNMAPNPTKLTNIIEDAKSANEIIDKINKANFYRKFHLDRETSEYIRLEGRDAFGNISYLILTKEKPVKNNTNNYLAAWIKKNHKTITNSDWFVENNLNEDELTPELFMELYVIPTIESNIEYDFNTSINGEKLV